jgi:hypothetical protein
MTTALVYGLGAAVGGAAQAALLARAARTGLDPLGALLRAVLAVAVLLAAARAGHLLAGVAGWAAGFGASSCFVLRRRR